MQEAFEALDELSVVGVGFAANEALFDSLQSKEQTRESLDDLSMKVLQMLENVASDSVPVDAVPLAVEPCDGEGAHFEFVHDLGRKFQVLVVNQQQISAQRFQMPISDDEAIVILANGQLLIGVQNNGQKHFVGSFEQTKRSAFFFKSKTPVVVNNLERVCLFFNFKNLHIFRIIERT